MRGHVFVFVTSQQSQSVIAQTRFRTFRRNIIGAEKNELTLLYSALIKKNSCAKLIVLRLMVTRYIGNMIVFLHCHYTYLSITITSKLSALNHSEILYYCNCHATISSSVHTFASFFSEAVKIDCVAINEATTCDASLQVLCNAACVKTQHCQLSKTCVKLLSIKVHKT